MNRHLTCMLATAFLAGAGVAVGATTTASLDAAEKRYAEDRKLCADESSSGLRMQCLRDAKAEYERATNPASAKTPEMRPAEVRPVDARAAEIRPCAECGKVSSVRMIEKEGDGGSAGMVVGGLVGGLLGNQIGKGSTRTVATLAGAGAGAYAGNMIDKNSKTVRKWEVAVRFESGEERTYSFDRDPGFSTGAEVKASGGSIVPR